MYIKIIEDNFSIQQFNTCAPHPLQSFEWGQARIQTGLNVVRLGEYNENNLQNVFTMTIHEIPYTPYKLGYIPRSVLPSKQLLDYLLDWCRKQNVIFIKFEPYVKKTTNYQLPTTNSLHHSPHPLFPSWTQMIDLIQSEESLLSNMKQKTRYNIRLAEKKGVTVREESNERGFETFIKLYFDTTKRQHYLGHDETYHRIIWNALKGKIAHILIAYYEDEPLAAYELFHLNDTLYYPYGGSSDSHRNLMAANLIMWEAIRLGKNLGATTFDLWGSLPPDYDPDGKWSGFTKFKEGYGTSFVEFIGSYDLVAHATLYKTYNVLNVLRNMYIKVLT